MITHDTSTRIDLATFYLGDLWIGADLQRIQEINRDLELTTVAHSPDTVRGVVNLRGDVVTVLDLGALLDVGAAEITGHSRNVIITAGDERIGLLVDRVGDVVSAESDSIARPPSNSDGISAQFLSGVIQTDHGLLSVLDPDAVIDLGESDALRDEEGRAT